MSCFTRIFISVAALSLLFCGPARAAEAPPKTPDPPVPTFHTRPKPNPDELERALLLANPEEARRSSWWSGCTFQDKLVEVVRHAWDLRDSAGATGATKDPVVRALMARCLVEYKPRFTPLEPDDAPVLAQLRLALASSDPDQVYPAAWGLSLTATEDDVKAMMSAAARVPSRRSLIVSALSNVCRADAIGAAETIKATVTDERQLAEIENIEAHAAKTRRLMCGYDANIVGSSVSQADIDDFLMPGAADPDRNADISGILSSTNVHDARKLLLNYPCRPDDRATVDIVHKAWAARNAGASNLAIHNFSIRVLLAKCLVNATSPAARSNTPEAVKKQLREAVRSEDILDFLAGAEGLSRIATAADVSLIEGSLEGKPTVAADMVVSNFTRSCAPGAQEAVGRIRARTTQPHAYQDMDWAIGATKRVREYVCGRGSGG